ncbi:MAG: hypothetical protein RLZZ502_1117 [Pseudomonadota bacterium]|jgi:rhodanese-related sulfurtransferase
MKELSPKEAHAFLHATPDAVLVDVRTEIEFLYVGHPIGAEHVAWHDAPDWEPNPRFVREIKKLVAGTLDRPVVLICRSGRRTIDAGKSLEEAGFTDVTHVKHGFEGDLDEGFHRNTKNGWRFDNLPWQQM